MQGSNGPLISVAGFHFSVTEQCNQSENNVPFSVGDASQDPRWMPVTTNPIYSAFSSNTYL